MRFSVTLQNGCHPTFWILVFLSIFRPKEMATSRLQCFFPTTRVTFTWFWWTFSLQFSNQTSFRTFQQFWKSHNFNGAKRCFQVGICQNSVLQCRFKIGTLLVRVTLNVYFHKNIRSQFVSSNPIIQSTFFLQKFPQLNHLSHLHYFLSRTPHICT